MLKCTASVHRIKKSSKKMVRLTVPSVGVFISSSFILSSLIMLQQGESADGLHCEHYNFTKSVSPVKAVYREVLCKVEENNCYALWYNASGVVTVQKKGCWTGEKTSKNECIGERINSNPNTTYCTCKMDMCNANLTFGGDKPTRRPKITEPPEYKNEKKNNFHEILYILVVIVCVLVMVIVLFLVYLKTRPFTKPSLDDTVKSTEEQSLLTTKELAPIQLKDVLSQGQFCNVRKGTMGTVDVAVKIFPITQRAKATPSAITEKDIYITCNLDHRNILKFIAAQSHEEANQTQLWLVTEYLPKGSLCDFLKQSTISWDELCHMAAGMASGMAYLHAEIPKRKPSIAHRDLKSKNVLVKNDLTCCISDFGLSLKFDSKEGPGDTHGQVGTRRYMAPEVLEGAINFSREAFLRIDMYAFGLCLWELLTRCTAVERTVSEYKFPFEEEVGMHPSLEELQETVVHKKLRPKFCVDWKKHTGLAGLITTTDECWDHDADARLTADCVAERVKQLRATVNAINQRQTNAPLSVSLNINSEADNVVLV